MGDCGLNYKLYQRLARRFCGYLSGTVGVMILLLLILVALVALTGCASYQVTCTPDGGKSVRITSARAVTGVAARITPDCGITAAVGTASGTGEVVEAIAEQVGQ